MINKRLSAIALYALLAISSASSLTYAVPVNAAETTEIETSVVENEENLDDSVLTPQEEKTDTGTSQDQDDDTFNVPVPQQDDTDDIDDPTNTTEPVISEEIGTDAGSGNEDESDGTGAVEDEPGTAVEGDETGTATESDEPGTGTEGDDSIVVEDLCATDGNSWDSGTIETEAACTTKGKIVFACTRCGETQVEVVPAKGHTFGEWTVVKKATTRVDGMRKRTCAECGETQSKVISNSRLLSVTDTEVSFSARARKPGEPRRVIVLSREEFIRRFLMHVLPSGFQKIRYYGFLNNRMKSANLRLIFRIQGHQRFQRRYTGLTMAELILAVWKTDIRLCPKCGCCRMYSAGRIRPATG